MSEKTALEKGIELHPDIEVRLSGRLDRKTIKATPTELPEPRAWQGIACIKHTSYHMALHFVDQGDWIHFWKGAPLAVHSGNIVYFSATQDAAETKLVNSIAPNAAHIRQDATGFDFIVGQVLCKAGLPLTQAVRG